jgi:glycogen(starch) synthase
MRILHLGFEDPRQPHAGGGSWRVHQINRRLASRHQITVLTHRFSGGQPGDYDGVRYVPVGVGSGRVAAISYWASVARYARAARYDLMIEEFGPPVGGGLAPLYSSAPVIGSVQWLFGDALGRKYHLPFGAAQRRVLQVYRHLITMTHDMAENLGQRYPGVTCWPVPNGLSEEDFVARRADSGDMVFLGRLDIEQKGLDILLDVMAALPNVPGRLLLLGDGPDRRRLETLIAARGLSERIRLLGYLRGREKQDQLASARAMLLPSRHETFGIAALEAFAAGCPVIGFDIPGLREVARSPAAHLVPPLDLAAMTEVVAAWWSNPSRAREAGAHGPAIARRYHWDQIALVQERVYEAVLSTHGVRP